MSDPSMGPAGIAAPDMADMLQTLAQQNPQLAWMAQLLQAQRQAAAVPVESSDAEECASLREALAQAEQRVQKLGRVALRLRAELEAAHARLADLAAAFGACGLCWGDDPSCAGCRGRGRPGRFHPDHELQQRWFATPPARAPHTTTSTDPGAGHYRAGET